jgi:hypothetical protein
LLFHEIFPLFARLILIVFSQPPDAIAASVVGCEPRTICIVINAITRSKNKTLNGDFGHRLRQMTAKRVAL